MKTNSVQDISNRIKAEAKRLGFSACGIAKAQPVCEAIAQSYRKWLADGCNAGMEYLSSNLEKRLNPLLLMPEAKSIICLALNYYPGKKLQPDQYQFAYYAYGQDYHEVMKKKMREMVTVLFPDNAVKLCCDTVPILDRYWAQMAGLGWIGKNSNLIIPHAGSFFFLCEILVDIELEYDTPMENHCGTCTRCLEACPTHALRVPYYIDARKCLSYLTIEHRGDFPANVPSHSITGSVHSQQDKMVNGKSVNDKSINSKSANSKYIYGCDRCQLSCPYNRFALPTKIEEFTPKSEFLNMRTDDWHQLTIEQYQSLFKGSAVKRAKYEGLVRNIRYVSNAVPSPQEDC